VGEVAQLIEEVPIEVSSVPKDMVWHVWKSQLDMIEGALSHGQGDSASAHNVLAEIYSGRNILWVVHRGEDIIAVVVLSVKSTSTLKKLFVELIAGKDLPSWSGEVQQLLIDFKDIIGADCIEASCRPGLAKYLGKSGWSQKAIIMELT